MKASKKEYKSKVSEKDLRVRDYMKVGAKEP